MFIGLTYVLIMTQNHFYKSCELLEHGICFYNWALASCCYMPQTHMTSVTYIQPYYNGENINTDLLSSQIKRWRENAKQGKYLKQCKNCCKLEEKNWDDEFYINQVYITHFESCNLNCIYCINDNPIENRNPSPYKIIPVLDDLREKNILKENCEFHIGGGEFTIYPECDEIIEKYVLTGFVKRLCVATNGIRYSENLYKAMDTDKACVIISVDCGSSKLFKRIKGVDCFDKLKESLSKYTRSEKAKQNTFLKYIVLPQINDNKNEFKKFLNLASEYSIKGIKIDVEGRYSRNCNYKIDKKISEFILWAENYAKDIGFDVELFSFVNQMNEQNK